MTLGEKIKELRESKNLTQMELAKILSIGHSTLACYETNKRQVPYGTLKAISKFFDVSTDYLLGLKDEY